MLNTSAMSEPKLSFSSCTISREASQSSDYYYYDNNQSNNVTKGMTSGCIVYLGVLFHFHFNINADV